MAIKRSDDTNSILPAVLIVVSILLVIGFAAYYFLYTPKCDDSLCFQDALWKCKRTQFLDQRDTSTWEYKIKGFTSEGCRVNVKAISLVTDSATGSLLQGKEMDCYISRELLGSFMPEEKIEYCHGLLKEGIQSIMIEKMHLYIIKNIGQINQTKIA